MITSLDDTIKKLLTEKGQLESSQVDIRFETPDREWSASLSRPTVNVYLYDIRENHELRGMEWRVTKDRNGIATRKKNPSRIDVSYFITVWANDTADEHRLLWQVMSTLFKYPVIPGDMLCGQLAQNEYPVKASTVQPDHFPGNPSDFWAAVDNKLKASLNYVVTLPLDTDVAFTAPMVRTKTIEVKPPDSGGDSILQIAGYLQKAGQASTDMAGATVFASEAGISAAVKADGSFTFPNIRTGKHTLKVISGGKEIKTQVITVPAENYDLDI